MLIDTYSTKGIFNKIDACMCSHPSAANDTNHGALEALTLLNHGTDFLM